MTGYKICRPDGTDLLTGTVDYAGALVSDARLEVPDAPPTDDARYGEKGLHVCRTQEDTLQFAVPRFRPHRWFEAEVDPADVLEEDPGRPHLRTRVRALRVTRELFLEDLFEGPMRGTVRALRLEFEGWPGFAWTPPASPFVPAGPHPRLDRKGREVQWTASYYAGILDRKVRAVAGAALPYHQMPYYVLTDLVRRRLSAP